MLSTKNAKSYTARQGISFYSIISTFNSFNKILSTTMYTHTHTYNCNYIGSGKLRQFFYNLQKAIMTPHRGPHCLCNVMLVYPEFCSK